MGQEELIKISPDKEMVKSILAMAEIRESRIQETDLSKFASLLVEDYYEVIKELATAVMNLDGYKTTSHKTLFFWLKKSYTDFTDEEMQILDNLRIMRNDVVYEGFFVKTQYLERKLEIITKVISKLKSIIRRKI